MYRILITPPREGEASADVSSISSGGETSSEHASPKPSTRKAANAELQFSGQLSGLTLCGFTIWDNGPDGYRVSFPTRRFVAAGGNPASFLLLRATNPDDRTTYERLKGEILEAFLAFTRTRAAAGAVGAAAS